MQGAFGATKILSPGLKSLTACPTSTTSAPISCPGTSGALGRRYHSTISLPQMPHAITLTSISSGPGLGVGTSSILISWLLYHLATFIFESFDFGFRIVCYSPKIRNPPLNQD